MYDAEESARRLAGYRPALRELVHLSCGHLALEPRLDRKGLLGDHLHDDARSVAKLDRRIAELGGGGGAPDPGPEIAAALDRARGADTPGYLEIAYGELKPALVAAIGDHLADVDPLADEPTLRLLTQLLHRQERHVAELPATGAAVAAPGKPHELAIMPPVERPARDPFIRVAATAGGHPVHALMNAELCAAELAARTSHEHPELPLDFHVDMARLCWDRIRHAELLDRVMASELGCHWGEHPVDLDSFGALSAQDVAGRLAALAAAPETNELPAATAGFLRANAATHAAIAARWSG